MISLGHRTDAVRRSSRQLVLHLAESRLTSSPIEIKEVYSPAIIGETTQVHTQSYLANYGLGDYFEK